MIKDMAAMAAECIRTPGRTSIWSPELDKYVCPDSEEGKALLQSADPPILREDSQHPTLKSQFKLVFVTSVALTVFFLLICVTLTLIAGKEPPTLHQQVVTRLLDIVQIGAGAVVGLLGGKRL
jgi:hypothetical protein